MLDWRSPVPVPIGVMIAPGGWRVRARSPFVVGPLAIVVAMGAIGPGLAGCHRQQTRNGPTTAVVHRPAPSPTAAPAPTPRVALDADGFVKVDVFAIASQDRWTAIRNPYGVRLAEVRLSESGDAALITWEEFGQFWCGFSTPGSDCKGGRWFDIVGRAGVLPERFARATPADSKVPVRIATDHSPPIAAKATDMTFGAFVGRGADVPVSQHVHDFEFSIDYAEAPAFRRAVRLCHTMTLQVPGRRFTFVCDGLRNAEVSN